jgi:hypothetical protein
LTSAYYVRRMILKINKGDYERLIGALEVAKESETNANKRRLLNLTKKKIGRQNEIFLKKNQKRTRRV